jgi:hypothetical protein
MALLDALFSSNALRPSSDPRVAVDLGYGDSPATTLRWAERLKAQFPRVLVVGVEIEEARVERAKEAERPGLEFRKGGFGLSRLGLPAISVIRCMNVLRGYGLEQVRIAQAEMARALSPGGLLVEGSTDKEGSLLSAHVWRRDQGGPSLKYEGLVFGTDGRRGFGPRMFRDVLPRDLRRHCVEGEPVHAWLQTWHALFLAQRIERRGSRVASDKEKQKKALREFDETARLLARQIPNQTRHREGLSGYVWFTPPAPSTRKEVLRPCATFFSEEGS